jgi:hypothetical protein
MSTPAPTLITGLKGGGSMKWDGKVDVVSELEAFGLRIEKGEKLSDLEHLELRLLVLMDEYDKLHKLVRTFLDKAFVLQNDRLTRLEEALSESRRYTNESLNNLNESLKIIHERIKRLEEASPHEKPPSMVS